MSSPIFGSLPSSATGAGDARNRSSSFGGPRLDLVLRPSLGLGPFKLGHSLWHVLNYLRSQQSLFPHINIVYDESSPRLAPIVVTIQPSLHLVFHGTTQRLILITLENLDTAAAEPARSASPSVSSKTPPSPEPSHRPVNIIYNGKVIYASAPARGQHVALNRSTLHQILGPTYPGHSESTSIAPDSLVALAYASRTTPVEAVKNRSEFLLTYPGLAFCFALKPDAQKQTEVDKFQPVSTIHIFSGSDPNDPQDVLVAPSPDPALSDAGARSRSNKAGTLSPTAAMGDYQQLNTERDRAALDVEAIYVRCPALVHADITPGKGVALHFAKAGASRTASPLPDRAAAAAAEAQVARVVELVLGVTTPQDALCDLGQPQRIFYKEDDRMRIHGGHAHRASASQGRGTAGGVREGSENSTSTEESLSSHDLDDAAFFYNYFDLGLDLLFSKQPMRMPSSAEAYSAAAQGQARLEKVVCHTNVPGDALFQRYNRCAWRLADTGKAESTGGKADKPDKSAAAFSFQDHFDSTLSRGQDDRGMELDRGTSAELRGSGRAAGRPLAPINAKSSASDSSPERDGAAAGELLIDLSTRLVGRDGMVLEVAKDGSMVGVVVF